MLGVKMLAGGVVTSEALMHALQVSITQSQMAHRELVSIVLADAQPSNQNYFDREIFITHPAQRILG
jgi:hypothetical protein